MDPHTIGTTVLDMDRDGDLDILFARRGGNANALYEKNGLESRRRQLPAADFLEDGDSDTDADSDSDTHADTDADTDADSEADLGLAPPGTACRTATAHAGAVISRR